MRIVHGAGLLVFSLGDVRQQRGAGDANPDVLDPRTAVMRL
jgi:hypothetical protein